MMKIPLWIYLTVLFVIGITIFAVHAEDYDAEKEAAARIKRQLELANEMRAERLKKQREKEQQAEQEERTQKHCTRLKDELRRLGERRRWYRLDDNGERVFLSDAEVRHKKDSIQKQYDQHCED
jgi:hypothetical protein